MKRALFLILAFVLCLSLCACGEDTPTVPNDTKPSATAHSHDWKDATCRVPKTCSICGETEGEIGGHAYAETAKVEATKSTDGFVTYTCSFCNDSYQEVLYAAGSVGLEYQTNEDGTYVVVGLGTCTDSHVVIPAYYEGVMVTAIAQRAFYACTTIEEITIPETVSSIGTQIFYKCSALHTVYYNATYSGDNPFLSVANIKKVVFGGNSIPPCICYEASNIEEVVILDGVTEIGYGAFWGCSSLTNIVIPDSITSIDWYTFHDCSSLTSITIPDSVTSIGEEAFYGCSSLTSITIPESVTSIGGMAFYDCSSLTDVVIPNGVTSISSMTFFGCSSLTNITIPDSITSIGRAAFCRCSSLVSITIPDSVTSIGEEAFHGCSSLTSITIPDSVTSISSVTFFGCSSLTSIVIPDSVTNIGEEAFYSCSSLTSVVIPDSVTSIGRSAFCMCTSLREIQFGGTREQWNAISKDVDWNYYSGNYTIYCTDGEINK